MVDFHNPVTMAREFVAFVNLWHALDGVFIWEFFTTLHYEWDVIRGHRPYRWTIWIYSLTRVAALMAIVLNMISLDNPDKVNCQVSPCLTSGSVWLTVIPKALYTMNNFFSYVAFGSASLLIVLRIIAIWNRKTIIVIIATGLWLADVAFLIYGTATLRGVWSDESSSCVIINMQSNKINIIAQLTSDVILLLIMVAGLLRLRLEIGDFGLGRILWNQSLIWLMLATVAEVPPAVKSGYSFWPFLFPLIAISRHSNFRFSPIHHRWVLMELYFGKNYQIQWTCSSEVPGAWHTVSKLRFRSRSVPLKQVSVEDTLRSDSDQHPTSQSKVETLTPAQTLKG
ncbi:hypothetical protein V8E52_004927 [Russula decolorans]